MSEAPPVRVAPRVRLQGKHPMKAERLNLSAAHNQAMYKKGSPPASLSRPPSLQSLKAPREAGVSPQERAAAMEGRRPWYRLGIAKPEGEGPRPPPVLADWEKPPAKSASPQPLSRTASSDNEESPQSQRRRRMGQEEKLDLMQNNLFMSDACVAAEVLRLQIQLESFGLEERTVRGDGNCQFSALSDQLYGTPDHHRLVREAVVIQLRKRHEWYSEWVIGTYEAYVCQMMQLGAWGDHVTLQAAADHYGTGISLLSSFEERSFIEVVPQEVHPEHQGHSLWMSFWAGRHYNSLAPVAEAPGE